MAKKDWQLPTVTIKEYSQKKSEYCLCIPIINEGEKFKKQIKSLKKYTDIIDILILDGGSTDGSTNNKFLKENKVRALLTKKSYGKQGTQLRMGFAYALEQKYKGIITVDGNNKDGVSAIPRFINAIDLGYDFVQGSRFIKGGQAINTPFIRWFGIRFIYAPFLSFAAKYWYTDVTNGFRAYTPKFLLDKRVQPFRDIFIRYEFMFYLLVRAAQLGYKVTEIPVKRAYPKGEVPTKISGLKAYYDLLLTLYRVVTGYYHPKDR